MDHEQIWAPWRLGYIIGERVKSEAAVQTNILPGGDPECFLCQDAAAGDDRTRLIVERGPHTISLLNRFPYNNGHLLVAPRRHVARLDQLDACEQLEVTQAVTQMTLLLEKVLKAQGFNIGLNLGSVAGAGLPGHLHWHIVPRWSGDTNFMPVMAGVRVIPQSLDALWEALCESLKEKPSDSSRSG